MQKPQKHLKEQAELTPMVETVFTANILHYYVNCDRFS